MNKILFGLSIEKKISSNIHNDNRAGAHESNLTITNLRLVQKVNLRFQDLIDPLKNILRSIFIGQ